MLRERLPGVASSQPERFSGDPADCVLIATARTLGASLATRDRVVRDYAAHGEVKGLAA